MEIIKENLFRESSSATLACCLYFESKDILEHNLCSGALLLFHITFECIGSVDGNKACCLLFFNDSHSFALCFFSLGMN